MAGVTRLAAVGWGGWVGGGGGVHGQFSEWSCRAFHGLIVLIGVFMLWVVKARQGDTI